MKEHLVAFVYIVVMACVAFVLMVKPLTAQAMTKQDFALRRNVWLAVTAATFLAHNFWLAMLAVALIVGFAARRESNPVALYCVLLFAVPQFAVPIPGFGAINKVFDIDYPRVLALALLLPAAVRLYLNAGLSNPRLRIPDMLFGAYFVYVIIVNATTVSITELMRDIIYIVLDHALLYYVITRSVVDRRRLIDVMASFVMGMVVISLIAMFENLRSWLVYESLRGPLGVPDVDLTMYLRRGADDGGSLRALTTTGNAIAMGFMAMIAIIWQLLLARGYTPKWLGLAVVLIPVGGMLAAVSRGPWLGCAFAVMLGLATGPGAKRRIMWMLAVLPVAVAALLLSPRGQKFIDLLPFVGSVEAENVSYRALLIDRAMIVFWQNPIFGSLRYIYNPVLEEMRQGQGIIDIVNSYIGVALPYGVIGLLLFVLPSVYALAASWLTSRRLAKIDLGGEAAGRALAMSMVAILLVIGTVSHYFHIPIVHWMIVGLCVTYAVNAPAWRKGPAPVASPGANPRGLRSRSTRPRMASQPPGRPNRRA
jgi:O-Antigen ligase